jgi:hypothetical protein
LEKIDVSVAENVLAQNYPAVPSERCRAYASLSGGYIRLAADLCRYDPKMSHAGGLGPAIPSLQDYYRRRIPDQDQESIEAIALVHRIGHSDDVADQLDLLSDLTGIAPDRVRETVRRLKDAPGFVVVTPRYFYVTPQIIAEIAFQRAWRRWAFPNPTKFLDGLPEGLRPSFEVRVRGLADSEVRSIVSAHFRQRVAGLRPADLADHHRVKQLLDLLETDPDTYLPQLTRLIQEASAAELAAIDGHGQGGRGTRRGIVWAGERLASFPEYFPSAELVLRRLALVETEPGIGNNATGIWRQLFRVYLSGTAVPFLERFDIFKRMVLSSNPGERDLAMGGLDHLIRTHVTRAGKPSLVGGRIPPRDWLPRTSSERAACLDQVVTFAEELLVQPEPLAQAGWDYFTRNLQTFLAWGGLDRLKAIVQRHAIPERLLGVWLEELDKFFQYERGDGTAARQANLDYCDRVRAWQMSLLPSTFSGRLRSILGKDLWHHNMREGVWKQDSEVAPLVQEVVGNPLLLEANLDFLMSPEARSASTFGVLLGRQDASGKFLDPIMRTSRESHSSALLRGYVGGLLQGSPDQINRVSKILDILEDNDPEIAAEIIVAAIEVTDAVTRLGRMIGKGRLPPTYAQYLHYGPVLRAAPSTQIATILKSLASPGCSVERLRHAVELIGDRLHDTESALSEDAETIATMQSILARSATVDDHADYWWGEAIGRLAPLDSQWTATIAASAISGDDFGKRDKALGILADLAASSPSVVMEVVGAALLDPQQGWHWLIGSNREVFLALPVDVVMRWLSQAGVEGARRVARHLPSLAVASDGTGTLPELTERVLRAYGDDQVVFDAFSAGRHDMEASWGPLSSHYEGQAQVAKAFLNHPLAVIRRWAEQEIASAEHSADYWRKQEEDETFES